MDTEDVGLQISLLRGTVGTVAALERPVTYGQKEWPVSSAACPSPVPSTQRTMIVISSTISAIITLTLAKVKWQRIKMQPIYLFG